MMVVRHGEKPNVYKDDYKKYQRLYNFLNIYSEVFAYKNTRTTGESTVVKNEQIKASSADKRDL